MNKTKKSHKKLKTWKAHIKEKDALLITHSVYKEFTAHYYYLI